VTTLYLAWSSGCVSTLEKHYDDDPVNVLVAYPELKSFMKNRDKMNIDKWVLDSGAFGAYNSGKVIDLDDYIQVCKDLEGDVHEIFGLDVIHDAEGTRVNLEKMWKAGVPAIPAYHQGSPEWALEWAHKNAPTNKIGVGGVARWGKDRVNWVKQIFARIWPCKVHGFGLTSGPMLKAVPFHSCDAVSWTYGPAWGVWAGYGQNTKHEHVGAQVTSNTDYWGEVLAYRKRENYAKFRWRREMKLLEELQVVK